MATYTNMSSYPGGFAAGIMIRGVPLIQTHPGRVFWVDNSTAGSGDTYRTGSDGNKGTFDAPFATINYAVNTACRANKGDIVFVKPGHAETIADATTLTLGVAGVAVIGLGSGSNRPTLTFSTATTANIPVTAANITVHNMLFKANKADVASVFTATSTNTPKDFVVSNCEFRDGSSILNFITVVTGNATANSMDGLTFVGNKVFSAGTTAATTAIKMLSATDRMDISDNFFVHAILNDTASVLAMGANDATNLKMARNIAYKPNTSSTGGSFVSSSSTASTGMCHDNYFYQLDATAGIWIATGTKLGFQNNYSPITGAADKSGLINPAAV